MAASGPLHLQFPLSGKFFLRYSPRSFCPFTQVSLLTSPLREAPPAHPHLALFFIISASSDTTY